MATGMRTEPQWATSSTISKPNLYPAVLIHLGLAPQRMLLPSFALERRIANQMQYAIDWPRQPHQHLSHDVRQQLLRRPLSAPDHPPHRPIADSLRRHPRQPFDRPFALLQYH